MRPPRHRTPGAALALALVVPAGVLAGCGAGGPAAVPGTTRAVGTDRQEDTVVQVRAAVLQCRALRRTLHRPVSAWPDGIFAIGATGTPPALGRAITRMEIAVGDSYGPLSGYTLSSIDQVGALCAARPIHVTGVHA